MRIVLATGIFPPDIGGPATYTSTIAAWFVKQGHEVIVITYSDSSANTDKDLAYPVKRITRKGPAFWRYVRFAVAVYRYSKWADVIYAQGPVSEGLPAIIASMLRNIPFIVKVVGDYAWEQAQQQGETVLLDEFLTYSHEGKIGKLERIERWVTRQAQMVITPSRYLKTVVEKWGVKPECIEVILNAQQVPSFNASIQHQDRKIFFTAGRAVPWKGIKELITWWSELPDDYELRIAGSGPEDSVWKSLIEASQAKNRIIYLGALSRTQMFEQFSQSSAFLLNSGYEGYPNIVAEAASMGVPCIVSDKGGNPETKEQFGSLITVLPYNKKDEWLTTLRAVSLTESTDYFLHSQKRTSWVFEDMASTTERVLLKMK